MNWLDDADLMALIRKSIMEDESKRIYNEMLMKEQIESAVIICNRENKHRLKGLFPNLCVLGTDHCDDKIYMVTDKAIAENIRESLKEENIREKEGSI